MASSILNLPPSCEAQSSVTAMGLMGQAGASRFLYATMLFLNSPVSPVRAPAHPLPSRVYVVAARAEVLTFAAERPRRSPRRTGTREAREAEAEANIEEELRAKGEARRERGRGARYLRVSERAGPGGVGGKNPRPDSIERAHRRARSARATRDARTDLFVRAGAGRRVRVDSCDGAPNGPRHFSSIAFWCTFCDPRAPNKISKPIFPPEIASSIHF